MLVAAVLAASPTRAADTTEQAPSSPAVPSTASRYFALGATSGDSVGEMAGSAICRLLMRLAGESALSRAESRRCSLDLTGGAGETLNQLAARRVAFAIVPAALAAAAREGDAPTQVRPFADVRAVFSLGDEPLHLVVARDSGIASVADLRGRRVNIGTPHSVERELMEALLAFYQLRREDLAQATEMAPGRVASALCAGDLDAAGLVVGGPAVAVARATDECGARLLPIPGEAVAAVAAAIPGTTPTVIRKGTFATTNEPVASVGVVPLLATSAAEDEDDVYALTRTVMEHLNEIRGYHPALADLAPERMVRDGILVPLHPGAQRYFRERGWLAGG
jgi:TRAP transporter TAXI family solute receptor